MRLDHLLSMENVRYVKTVSCRFVFKKKDNKNLKTNDGDSKEVELRLLFNFQGSKKILGRKKVGVTNAEGPPVPIPNTEVKLCSGEDTWREAARENSTTRTHSWCF